MRQCSIEIRSHMTAMTMLMGNVTFHTVSCYVLVVYDRQSTSFTDTWADNSMLIEFNLKWCKIKLILNSSWQIEFPSWCCTAVFVLCIQFQCGILPCQKHFCCVSTIFLCEFNICTIQHRPGLHPDFKWVSVDLWKL